MKKNKSEQLFLVFVYLNVFCKGIGLGNSSKVYFALLAFGIIALLPKILNDKYTKKELLMMFMINMVGVISLCVTKSVTLLITTLCLSGMKNVDTEKVFKGMFKIRLITYVGMIVLSLTGIIENEYIYMWRDDGFDTRYSLGFEHPNTAHINLLILLSLYIFIRYDKLKTLDFIIMFCANLFIYSYTLSRTSFICILLLIMLTIYSKLNKKDKLLAKLPSVIFIGLFSFSVIAAITYGKIKFVTNLDSIFNGRIYYSHYYMNTYGVKLFGSYLKDDTNALFDNGYLLWLIQYGLIAVIVFGYLLLKVFKDVRIKNDKRKAVIIIPFLFSYFTESFMPNIFMNIILMFVAPLIFNQKGEGNKNEIQNKNYSIDIKI